MKEEKIINNSVSDTNKEEVVRGIDDKLDNIGIYLEKVEAFNQLINIKLDEIKDPPTKAVKTNNHLEDIALDLFNAQSNISNYIMLSYTITDYTIKIQEIVNEIHEQLKEIK